MSINKKRIPSFFEERYIDGKYTEEIIIVYKYNSNTLVHNSYQTLFGFAIFNGKYRPLNQTAIFG